jgi:uncharacterized membrane protein
MKVFSLYAMVVCYVAAGINHFWHPGMYKRIVPSYLPFPLALVYVSGVCEVAFALMLIPEGSRRVAAWLIIAMLIAIFPANIQMTLDFYHRHSPYAWLTVLRLPLQLVLIYWAYCFTTPAP